MNTPDWKKLTKRRVMGIGVMVAGLTLLLMPVFLGGWIIALLGIVLIGAGLFKFIETVRSPDDTRTRYSYLGGVVITLLGIVLFLSPRLVLSALLIAIILFLVVDGGIKVYAAYRETGPERWWGLFNGLFTIFLALLVWFFITAHLGLIAIGLVLGLRLMVEGWTMFFLPEKSFELADTQPDTTRHPDSRLRLEPSQPIKEMQDAILAGRAIRGSQNIVWSLTLLAIFFGIHVLRTEARWSFIGFISPFTAVLGDAIVALILALVLLLPLRLLFRKLTRPIERIAWRRFEVLHASGADPAAGERILRWWLNARMAFAIVTRENRSSLNRAFWNMMRIGLPLTAIIVAINSIWGFSWYFNSENWASGVWQRITEKRIDVWRQRMAEDVEKLALSSGVPREQIFAVDPGIREGDFSFIVIGDTGEGDPSQMALRDQLIAASKREQVKFLVLSSDVIYPDGKMKDYEKNFYLPFHGFEKPIYAIPGNHDWFDANEGFNANFLERDAAILSLKARLSSDLKTEAITTDERFNQITAEADRLRKYYRIRNGLQRAPFFEFHTPGFSLIAVDTGILRTVDPYEFAWLEQALTRAGANFKLVVLGHPFFVAGANTAENDAAFEKIHATMKRFSVDVVMAGDTHDFEFYKERYASQSQSKQDEMLHFVNGGGGAYLSIGTAIGFPENPVVPDYAFYPRTDEITTKIKNEAPYWKLPFLVWLRVLHGYPFDHEMVSGAFDFNYAPFFQSFLEVFVERSQNRVRFLLYGVNGQLRWRDIQIGGQVKPADKTDDDFVEFIAPLHD
jgi:uncharacterized membrane protein HdeD (DUF308 family)